MTLLYIAHSSALHGAGLALINIVKGMLKLGVEPVVLLPNTGPVSEQLVELGVKCFFVPFYMEILPPANGLRNSILWIPRLARTLLSNTLASVKLREIIRKTNPDIIHTNTGVIHFGARVARSLKIPHVWHVREFQDLDFGWTPIGGMSFFSRLLQRENNYCVSITRDVFEHHGLTVLNARVIYDGVFELDAPPQITWEKKNYFLFVGRIEEGKGVHDAVDAFIKVAANHPQKQLLIAGDGGGAFADALRHSVKRLGFGEQVEFLGFRSDVYQLMSEASALIVSSRFEGFGYITAEAMLNGCLVIGNNTAGTKEQFDNGLALCGEDIGIRYSGIAQLVQRIEEVCNTSADSYRMIVERAQRAAFDQYSVSQNISELFNYYQKVLEGNIYEKR